MLARRFVQLIAPICLLLTHSIAGRAAEEPLKIGLIVPLTGGYDGIHLIYEALKKTGGKSDGDALVSAMKGMTWESPRGPVSIDPETRDIVQNIYIRKVEKVDRELYNIEFATFDAVKDPGKAPK
jgi:Periplasmic binding protein